MSHTLMVSSIHREVYSPKKSHSMTEPPYYCLCNTVEGYCTCREGKKATPSGNSLYSNIDSLMLQNFNIAMQPQVTAELNVYPGRQPTS